MAPDESLELFPRKAVPETRADAPLAERMRPRTLDEIQGQPKLLGPDSALRAWVESGDLPSLILWGPPGSGKTTLARVLADVPGIRFEALSAVLAGVKEIRAVAERAGRERGAGRRTLLFLDEIHRLNRAQQDVLLPHVESGTLILVGATTENPSFEVNAPLLSRCRVLTLERLAEADLEALARRALDDAERGLGGAGIEVPDEVLRALVADSDGDARRTLGLLEAAIAVHRSQHGDRAAEQPLSAETLAEAAGRRMLLHDRDREEHYNVVSALIKSLRASDPDASLYYMARMLEAGEDPLFIARRLLIFASEDVGNADPAALGIATSAFLAVERLGLPEGRIPLAQAASYLACAEKSNASYKALGKAQEAIARSGSPPVPMHLRNAPTALMKSSGYGRDYTYAHDAPDGFVPDENLPETLEGSVFYEPKEIGREREIQERLAAWRERRRRSRETR